MIAKGVSQSFPIKFTEYRFVFLREGLICYMPCPWGGNEIHVQSSQPVRRECLKLMNSIGGDWFTSIKSDNLRAINLAIRCGMKLIKVKQMNGTNYKLYGGNYGSC